MLTPFDRASYRIIFIEAKLEEAEESSFLAYLYFFLLFDFGALAATLRVDAFTPSLHFSR
jgi:hypothetical protein